MKSQLFTQAYTGLNAAQKQAVDAIEGPVLVIAGPGTGKTQVLSVRIANILTKTDAGAGSILALTFTRAGVRAMRERLENYIGATAREVTISTFHSFAQELVSKHYALLDIDTEPKLLDDADAVILADELLETGQFEYLRPRGNPTLYFHDLRSLVSLLKRERISALDFMTTIDAEIENLKTDPESISSRGPSKGELKKEVEKKIESLARTREVVVFYEKYEALKYERGLMDYDDVLAFAVKIIESSEDVRDEIREKYLYVLVDEHQDSSGIQNSFLKAVWQGVEKPNIFVVGDDRQLIYGFGGASLAYFEEFTQTFPGTKKITLSENYRSTKKILNLADTLLKSSIADTPLTSNHAKDFPVQLNQYSYARDEIIAAGLYFKEQIANGVPPDACALLVPKNKHVRAAVKVLRGMGLPVVAESTVSLFEMKEMEAFTQLLHVIDNPYNSSALSQLLISSLATVPIMDAHAFFFEKKEKEISVETLVAPKSVSLFEGESALTAFGLKLKKGLEDKKEFSLDQLILSLGTVFLIETVSDAQTLLARVEMLRTLVHLASAKLEKGETYSLSDFLQYLTRLKSYGHMVPVATLSEGAGITIQTLHASKGLEYESVWIAHMNESIVLSGKKMAFTLPEVIEQKIESRDEAVARREVYVAITRAKTNCTISYAAKDVNGKPLELLGILHTIPETHFVRKDSVQTEGELLSHGPKIYVEQAEVPEVDFTESVKKMVRDNYASKKVSVTLLNNFFECPWKWYFRNFIQLPEQKTDSLIFGSSVHAAIEEILKQNKKPTETAIKKIVEEALLREGVQEETKKIKMMREGMNAVSNYIDTFYPNVLKERSTERSVSYKDPAFPHLLMYGKIDLTERVSPNSVLVTDFKTGSVKTPGVIEKETEEGQLSDLLRQLAMYSYLLQGVEKGITIEGSRLLFLEAKPGDKNALYSTKITDTEINKLKKDITEYDDTLREGTWTDRTCNFKPWGGAATECPYCALIKK